MDCPVCKEPMIVLELDEVEIDHCVACGGIWLDGGELELLLGDCEQKDNLLVSFRLDKKSTERPRKCPICYKKMRKIIVGVSALSVLIDKCSRGDGLWFDKGELQDIFDRANLDADNKIKKLLSDMFRPEQNC